MSESNSRPFPKTSVICYEDFESIMAENLVRSRVDLARIQNDFDPSLPRESATALLRTDSVLKNVIAFLVDNADDLIRRDEWNYVLESHFFTERSKRFKFHQEVREISEATVYRDPENLAHEIVRQYAQLSSQIAMALARIDDAYANIPGTNSSREVSQIVNELNKSVQELQVYLAAQEIRPVLNAKMLPVFEVVDEVIAVNDINLASFGFSVANALIKGETLDCIARDLALLVRVNLRPILQKLFEDMPEIAFYLDSIVFDQHLSKVQPWPFTEAVAQWNATLYNPSSRVPQRYISDFDRQAKFVYLHDLDINFENPDQRVGYRDPFETDLIEDCDDLGVPGIEVGLVSPGFVHPNTPMTALGPVDIEHFKGEVGLVRSIILN